jgi:hypothetical protein
MELKWVDVKTKNPDNRWRDVDVIVKIKGLSVNASEYEEYRVVKWRSRI